MKKILSLVASLALFSSLANAVAIGTEAGTVVTNQASLTYSVGSVAITAPITSNTDTFVVDDKVDLTVAHQDTSAVVVTPGTSNNITKFLLKNTGNKIHDFLLTSSQNNGNPFTLTDNKDVTITGIFVTDVGAAFDPTTATAVTYIDELGSGDSKTVYIVSSVANSIVNGDIAEVTLTAQVAIGGTANTAGNAITDDDALVADTAGSALGNEQIVFADGSGAVDGLKDGKHGDTSAYIVKSATIDLSKSSCVLSDSFSTDANAKRIPGATVRYAIDINNTGSVDAVSAVLSDTLQSDVTYVANTGVIKDRACNCATPAGTIVAGDAVTVAGQVVTADFGTVNAGSHECAYVTTTIN